MLLTSTTLGTRGEELGSSENEMSANPTLLLRGLLCDPRGASRPAVVNGACSGERSACLNPARAGCARSGVMVTGLGAVLRAGGMHHKYASFHMQMDCCVGLRHCSMIGRLLCLQVLRFCATLVIQIGRASLRTHIVSF